jgi:hypothetical protein
VRNVCPVRCVGLQRFSFIPFPGCEFSCWLDRFLSVGPGWAGVLVVLMFLPRPRRLGGVRGCRAWPFVDQGAGGLGLWAPRRVLRLVLVRASVLGCVFRSAFVGDPVRCCARRGAGARLSAWVLGVSALFAVRLGLAVGVAGLVVGKLVVW